MPRGWNTLRVAIAIVFLAVAAIAGAQPATKMARIGWLDTGDAASASEGTGDFRQGLRDLKYIDGQNVTVEYRHAGGSVGRLADLAAELVRQRVDVIVTVGGVGTNDMMSGRGAPSVLRDVSGSWRSDDRDRICASMVVGEVNLPARCQYWYRIDEQYFLSDSETDRSMRVLRRTLKP